MAFSNLLFCFATITVTLGSSLYWRRWNRDSDFPTDHYKNIINRIINQSVYGSSKHQSYNRLADFTDKFGNRIVGSENLENSIDYLLEKMTGEGLENVHGEDVAVPEPWFRNTESLKMITPKPQELAIMGLGSSVPTPEGGITAQVLVVRTFDELKTKADEAKGKIVVFNQEYHGYGKSVVYRSSGASRASEVGAVGALIRTVAPLSIYSPHTGHQSYSTDRKIPAASITIEDAEMMQRMQNRGENITLHLEMNCQTTSPRKSRNVVAEIRGTTNPEEVVVFGGHIDSWDVGKGAMDDGGGAFISWQVLSLVKQLGLKPRRTLRMVLWTGEEPGMLGGDAYYDAHKNQISNFKFVMESDLGTFKPLGITFHGNEKLQNIARKVAELLKPINATQFQVDKAGELWDGGDVARFLQAGVPGATVMNANEDYFYYHHSQGDTMTVQNPGEMDECAALWTSLAFVMADVDPEFYR